jgi:large subunit ribosomal protein LP1
MASNDELACIYAALALQDDGVPVTGEKIQALVKAAGIEIEPFWAGLYAKALDGVDVKVGGQGMEGWIKLNTFHRL